MQFWIHDVECLFVGHGKPCLEVFLIKFLDARRTLGLRVHVAKQLLRADVVAWGLQDMDEIPGEQIFLNFVVDEDVRERSGRYGNVRGT